MRRLFIALTMLVTMTMTTNAMSYEQARQQALFLTDKMAYELNLTEEQYEAAYEVNLDYLMSVNTQADLYGAYWTQRNLDLSYILFDWQYQAYLAASYFYRPLYWEAGYWHFGIYARYPYRDYFYFGRPHFWTVYRGGHSWRMNGGRSWYHGRSFGPRGGGRHHGMRDRFDHGDYGRGHGNGGFDHNRGGNGGRGNGGFGNGRSRGNGGIDNGRQRDNGGFGNGRSRGNGGTDNGRPRGSVTPGTIHNQNDHMIRSDRSSVGSRESSTRQTPGVTDSHRGSSVGNTHSGTFSRSGSDTQTPSRMTNPSRGMTAPSRSTSPSRSIGSGSSAPNRSFGSGSSSPSRSFGGSHSSSPSRSFGGSSSSPSRSFGGGSSSPSRSFGGGSHSGGGRSFGGGSHGGGSHGGGSHGGGRR